MRPSLLPRALLVLLAVAACRAPSDSADPHQEAPEIVAAALANPAFAWKAAATPHFHLHASTGSLAADGFDAVGRAIERARADVLARLNEQDAAERAEVFIVETREQMQLLVGQPAGGHTEPGANALFFTYSDDGAPAYRHELGHLYSWRRWGRPAALWLSEGVAVWAVGGCAGRDLHGWAAALDATGKLAPLDSLEPFDFSRAAPHLEAASFVQYVAESYGIEAVKALWQGGLAVSESATGRAPEELEGAWRRHVAQVGAGLPPEDRPETGGRIRCE